MAASNTGEPAHNVIEIDEEQAQRFEARVRARAPQIALMKRFREQLGLSQLDVAEALSMTQGGVSRIEARDTMLLGHFSKLARANGYDLELVLKKDGKRIPFELP